LVLLTETKETASFVLGGPFFRATTISLNFNETEIMMYENNVVSPIIPTDPAIKEILYFDQEMTYVATTEAYTGKVYIGADYLFSE